MVQPWRIEAAISSDVTDIYMSAYERPLRAPVTTLVADGQVTCRVFIDLDSADELLIATGHHDRVHAARGGVQRLLSLALSAAVERAGGRTVAGHSSRIDLRSRVTIHTFVLAPVTRRLIG